MPILRISLSILTRMKSLPSPWYFLKSRVRFCVATAEQRTLRVRAALLPVGMRAGCRLAMLLVEACIVRYARFAHSVGQRGGRREGRGRCQDRSRRSKKAKRVLWLVVVTDVEMIESGFNFNSVWCRR